MFSTDDDDVFLIRCTVVSGLLVMTARVCVYIYIYSYIYRLERLRDRRKNGSRRRAVNHTPQSEQRGGIGRFRSLVYVENFLFFFRFPLISLPRPRINDDKNV